MTGPVGSEVALTFFLEGKEYSSYSDMVSAKQESNSSMPLLKYKLSFPVPASPRNEDLQNQVNRMLLNLFLEESPLD